MEVFDLTRVVRAIQAFVVDDVSNWYVRRTRDRFWTSQMDQDKKAVYRTLWEVLLATAKLIAPFAPFMAEEIYQNLMSGEKKLLTVHLEMYPEVDAALINPDLEEHMGLVIDLVSLGRAARNKVQIKVRQPLPLLLADAKKQKILAPMEGLVKEELNVKAIQYVENPDPYVSYTIKPNFPVLGPKYGKFLKGIEAELAKSDAGQLVKNLRGSGELSFTISGATVTLKEEDVEIRTSEEQGYVVEMSKDNYVILNTTLTTELVQEGLAREIVSKVQNMRKSAGFELTDRIELKFISDDEVAAAVEAFGKYVADETLAVSVQREQSAGTGFEKWDINGHEAQIKVVKAVKA